MPRFLVFCAAVPWTVIEAADAQDAWQQASASWSDVSALAPLEEPAVQEVLQAHLVADPSSLPTDLRQPLRIWVDGSSLGNPGPAGWSYVRSDGQEASGGLGVSTNNVAELIAVLRALESLPDKAQAVVFTDSRNVVGWLQEGWKRQNAKVRELAEEIERLRDRKGVRLRFQHVAGHAGEAGNEQAHRLAMEAARAQRGST